MKTNFQNPNCTNQTLQRKLQCATISLHFKTPYFLVSFFVILVPFNYSPFWFEFYFPIADIIANHLYILFSRSRKTNTKCYTVKPLNSGHLSVLKNVSVIERCPLFGGNFKKIVPFGTKCFVRYSSHLKKRYRFLIFVRQDLVVLENCTRMKNLDIKSRGIRDYDE